MSLAAVAGLAPARGREGTDGQAERPRAASQEHLGNAPRGRQQVLEGYA